MSLGIFEVGAQEPKLFGLECLIRGPGGTNGARPAVLFEYVRRKHAEAATDRACVAAALAEDGLECRLSLPVRHPLEVLMKDVGIERLAAGVSIAWLRDGAGWPITAVDATGRDLSRELFAVHGQALVTRRELVPIMMTTDAGIAASDCLFYAVEETV